MATNAPFLYAAFQSRWSMRTAAFSIISSNYGHFAHALMASLRRQHPEWDRFVLIVGDASSPPDELFVAVPLDALALPNARQFQFRYTLLELNTAVKPWMFEHVFARGYDRVVYFDPDVFLYSSLDELDPDAFLTLTPHLTGFIGGDDHPSERSILQAGTYNLGFLAVSRGPELQRFLHWWQEKLEFQSVVDTARGLFVDQRWMDLAPGLFAGVAILRHEGYNVAYWNLRQRTVRRGDAHGFLVNGVPLRFFHFSGFDPAVPDRISVHDFNLTLNDIGDAKALFAEYAAVLRAADYVSFQRRPYAFARFADGTPLPDTARIAYRESPALQAAAGADPFAHPELFRGIAPERKRSARARRVAVRAYRALSSMRSVVGLLPPSLRTKMREFLLGKDVATPVRGTRD